MIALGFKLITSTERPIEYDLLQKFVRAIHIQVGIEAKGDRCQLISNISYHVLDNGG